MIKRLQFRSFFGLLIVLTLSFSPLIAQVDDDLTEKTKNLFNNLKAIEQSNNVLFGQEFFNSFAFSSGSAHGNETTSDAKTVTGSHPAVLGSDFHYYLDKDATERGYHTDAVKWAFQQGYVITFDWHISARGTASYEYTAANADLVPNIVNPSDASGDRDWFFDELDKIIEIINEDLVVGEDTIPIVLRPWHEMNGGWFWWGSNGATAAQYKELYKISVEYIKARTRTVLFCWSPNTPFGDARYPGDDYVDVVGVDIYEATTTSLRTELGKVVDFADAHNKIAVLSETGDRNNGVTSPLYWKNVILPGILDDPSGKSKKIAWMLTWINASWSVQYVAHSASSTEVKQSFISFKNSANVVFGDESEMPDMYSPFVPVSAEDELAENALQIFPNPSGDKLTIRSVGVEKFSTVRIFNTTGQLTHNIPDFKREVTLNAKEILAPGVYIIKATNDKKVITRKIVIR